MSEQEMPEEGMREITVVVTTGKHSIAINVGVTDEEVEQYQVQHGRPPGWGGMDPWERDPAYDVAARIAVERVAYGWAR